MRILTYPLIALLFLSGCSQTPAPVISYGAGTGPGSAGVHTVSSGETLSTISQRYRIQMTELVARNTLPSPDLLNEGQRLRLPPPEEYRVRINDSLSAIARMFNVSQTDLARENNLKPPYHLRAGQILKMPGKKRRNTAAPPASQPAQVIRATITPAPPVRAQRTARAQAPERVSAQKAVPVSKPQEIKKSLQRKPSRFIEPVSGRLISSFGPKKNGLRNDGVNIAAPRDTPVKSAAAGEVMYVGNAVRGYGNLVLVRHGGGYLTAYGHLGRTLVDKGDMVRQGQSLGTVGTSGKVTTPQLHFELRKGTKPINPKKYI